MKPIKKLEGKTVAIVGMGKSWFDYNLAKSHGAHFDEVWAINAVGSVIFHDRVFMMDPPSDFLIQMMRAVKLTACQNYSKTMTDRFTLAS